MASTSYEPLGVTPHSFAPVRISMHLMVDDVDAWVARAAEAGAKVTMPPA